MKASVYQTSRSNVLKNSRALSMGVPLAFVGAFYAIYHLYGFFNPQPTKPASSVQVQKAPEPYQPPAFANAPPPEPAQAPAQPQPNPAPGEEEVHYVDYLDKLASEYSIRSSGIIDSKKPGKELLGEIELLDSSYHLKERMTIAEIRAMGWTVTRTGYGLLLEKEGAAHVARTWPLDLYGRVDQRTVNSLGGSQPKAGASQAATEGTKLTVVNSGKPGLLW